MGLCGKEIFVARDETNDGSSGTGVGGLEGGIFGGAAVLEKSLKNGEMLW